MAEAASTADDVQGNKEKSMAWAHLAPHLATAKRGQEIVVDGMKMTCLSTTPLVFYIPALLKEEECDFLVERSRPHLEESFVMGGTGIDGHIDANKESIGADSGPYRVSDVAWLPQDDLLNQVQERLSALTGFDIQALRVAAEELQVIRYTSPGGVFKAHHDSTNFHPRLLTALIYLNSISPQGDNGESSGGTWFPFAKGGSGNQPISSSVSVGEAVASALSMKSAKENGLTVAPRKGAAILFFNHAPDGSVDPLAVHAGLPVLEGEKWAANYWFGALQ